MPTLHPRPYLKFLSEGRTICAADLDGRIGTDPATQGLFVLEARCLSRWEHRVNGRRPRCVACSAVGPSSWLGYYVIAPREIDEGAPRAEGDDDDAQQSLELIVARFVGEGMHEHLALTNYTPRPLSFDLEIAAGADFADQEEIGRAREPRGEVVTTWTPNRLTFDHRARHAHDVQGHRGTAELHRAVSIEVARAPSEAARTRDGFAFHVDLAPHQRWEAIVSVIASRNGEPLPLEHDCAAPFDGRTERERKRRVFLSEATRFTTEPPGSLAPVVAGALEQAKHDLLALRLHDLDRDDRAWVPAAGLPIYLVLFGRDSLTTSWQAGLLGPELMKGALDALARYQGKRVDDWRDEEPGRMMHEVRTGPLAELQCHPRGRSYSSITTSAFYAVILAQLWYWTGDEAAVRPYVEPALKALHWLEKYSDLDGDGFYEYLTHSKDGIRHQAWKDSSDAMVYEDGAHADPPIATSEEQGIVYAAKVQLADVLRALGEKGIARTLAREAAELKKRFNEVFWMEDEGYFAMALDAEKRPLRSIASNAGHCLLTAIADEALVERTAARLMSDELFSGWGIRTLSSRHPAYNPYSYHRGSVWPVENGEIALGLMRYGLRKEAQELCRAQLEASALFERYRLPEVLSGHPRDALHPFPALYPRATWPQAWSSSSVFSLLQSLLGLLPYAPRKLLVVDPDLPPWLPEIRLEGLRVGRASVDLRFWRDEGGKSRFEVTDLEGTLRVIRQPSLHSLATSMGERISDLLSSFLSAA